MLPTLNMKMPTSCIELYITVLDKFEVERKLEKFSVE
jgi:hypothetical protein